MPSNKSISTLFYSSDVSLDRLIIQVQPQNMLEESGIIIKKSMQNFDMQDKFCDVSALKNSWRNMAI